ncbi:MAG: sugar ABC transporter permease [Acidobacteriota bacterium]|nr:sugar ABC transporter permease [Acidobacteriota bacterium]
MRHPERTPWLFLAPHLSLFTVFILLPVVAVFTLSLFDWNLLGDHKFIGLANYAEILDDRQFWHSFKNTLVYASAVVPATMALGLGLALALNRPIPGRGLYRAALYLPFVISSVASGVIAVWIFDEHYGLLNALLAEFGLPRVPWLSSPTYAMPSVIATTIWLRAGLCMVVYLAALQDVPGELTEAAQLDGANNWKQFWFITWPLLRPSTTFLLITNLIYSLHVFDLIYVMTFGGPALSTTTLVQYLYENAFQEQRQGYACAISVVLFFILIALTSMLLVRRSPQRAKAA